MRVEWRCRFAPDEVEGRLPDPAAIAGIDLPPQLAAVLDPARLPGGPPDAPGQALFERTARAVRLAHARLALRHGSTGPDFHAYHNEGHILELAGARLQRLAAAAPWLELRDLCVLLLFAACHDLRQREQPAWFNGVGANERASVDEAGRILDACGFARDADGDIYAALALAIAGSTFDPAARWRPGVARPRDGALAGDLEALLDSLQPGWRGQPELRRAHELALMAADLDTSNVAEAWETFADSSIRLCVEAEMRAGRTLDAPDGAAPALQRLGEGQLRFFFELQRFHSAPGRRAFQAAKDANAGRVRAAAARMRELERPASAAAVIAAYRKAVAAAATPAPAIEWPAVPSGPHP